MNKRRIIRVRDVMRPDFDQVDGLATVADALAMMRHHANRCLIVERRHADDEYGIVLLSDIAKKVLARDRAPERVNIYEIMTKPVISVDPQMDIRYCVRLFERLDINLAPVMENRIIIGIVTFSDIVLQGPWVNR